MDDGGSLHRFRGQRTSYKSGRVFRRSFDGSKAAASTVILCVTVDRISRDSEHANGFLKRLKFNDIELGPSRAARLSRTSRWGCAHTQPRDDRTDPLPNTRRYEDASGRARRPSTCLAYGYRLAAVRDANGDRIPGYRDIDEDKANIVRWIFEQYAAGVSPRDLAQH